MIAELHIELTHKCNLKCVMCDHKLYNPPNNIDHNLFKKIINSDFFKKVKNVSLTGGEPTLHKNFVKYSRLILAQNKNLIILTNLYNITPLIKLLDSISKADLLKIHVGTSIDGSEKTHDRIRGIKGAYKKTLNNLNYLINKYRISTSITFTILKENFSEIDTVISLGKKTNSPVFIQNAIKYIKKDIYINKNQFIKIISDFKITSNKTKCFPLKKFIILSPEGDIYLCPYKKSKIYGNIKSQDIDTIVKKIENKKFKPHRYCRECILACSL